MTEKGSFPPPPGRGLYREPAKAPPAPKAAPPSHRLFVPPEYHVPLEAAKAPRPVVVVAPKSVWSRPPRNPEWASLAILGYGGATLWLARAGLALVLPFVCLSGWLLVRSFRPSPPPWWVYVMLPLLTSVVMMFVVLG